MAAKRQSAATRHGSPTAQAMTDIAALWHFLDDAEHAPYMRPDDAA